MTKMKCSEIEILHSIRGRMRLRFSAGLNDPRGAFRFLSAKGGIRSFCYNPVIRTATIRYANYLSRDDILARAAVLSVYGSAGGYVCVYDERKDKPSALQPSGQTSLVLALANIGVNLLAPATIFTMIMRWMTVGVTGYAIIQHGYRELNERGAFDPEVMSIVYLFETINQGPYYAPAIAWALTFGRHLLQKNQDCVNLRIVRDERNGEDYLIEAVNRKKRQSREFLSEFSTRYLSFGTQLLSMGGHAGAFVVSGGQA